MNYEQIVSLLNQKAYYFFGSDISILPPLDIETNSVTVCPNEEAAFNLRPPAFGSLKDHKSIISTNLDNSAVWRSIVGFSLAEKMVQNDMLFIYVISQYLNAGLKDLTNSIGSLQNRKVYFERPGIPKTYFINMENAAGFEIRLFVSREDVK